VRLALLALACTAAAPGAGLVEAFGLKWRVPILEDWKVERQDGVPVLELLVPRPSLQPRRPSQYALAETPDYLTLDLELEVRKEPASTRNRRTSVMIVYAWRDENHFNYAHLSVDSAAQQPVHNGIFHVYGGERVRISPTEGPPTLVDEGWHKVRLHYDGGKGMVEVRVNGKTSPSMKAVDLSLGAGRFGIGSFFDMGSFRNVHVSGVTR